MKHLIITINLLLCSYNTHLFGQLQVPYFNKFDSINDTLGWKHYAISGTDDWEIGVPTDNNFSASFSTPNAWVTYLSSDFASNSDRVLETPLFDLSDTTKEYALSFFQKRHTKVLGINFYLEYSNNNGNTWQLLNNNNAKKKNWQNNSGFSGNQITNFQYSAIDLSFIQGQDSIKFRFRLVSKNSDGEGWMIDNFKIDEAKYNIYATKADTIVVSKHCSTFELNTTLFFENQFFDFIPNTTNYYLSKDSLFDSSDTLISSKSSSINETIINWRQNINTPSYLSAGLYYIFYKHDALDTLKEENETDNISFAILQIDSVFNTPYIVDFENINHPWKPYLEQPSSTLLWELGNGYRHHLEDAHSGNNAWHTSKSINFNYSGCGTYCNLQYVESNYIDLTKDTGDIVFNIWFKHHTNEISIEYSTDCDKRWTYLSPFPTNRDDEWDFLNIPITSLSSYNNIKFRVRNSNNYLKYEGIIFDDVYIGVVKPDLSIERDKQDRFTSTLITIDTLKYFLNNSGLHPALPTLTSFYWSTDSIFDNSDILLGTKQEPFIFDTTSIWTNFIYSKPSNLTDKFYIFYVLDITDTLNEMREYNNSGYFTIYQQKAITAPYFNDFESEISGWRHNAKLGKDEWQWTTPKGKKLDKSFSGINAWITNDTGLVSSMSRMHLYSPIFDLSSITNPVLEFDMKSDSRNLNMSYSIDGGAKWLVLDTTNQSYNNWYYPMENTGSLDFNYYIPNFSKILFKLTERAFTTYTQYNSRDVERNTKYIIDLGFLSGCKNIQFRYNLATLLNNIESTYYPEEGALIDNFTINESYIDLNVNYKKALMISSKAEKIKFFMDIKNQGNYISLPNISKYYVSKDTILDDLDFYLGQVNVPQIRPDMSFYVNQSFNTPNNLTDYKYLIYELDANDTNKESNEINNIGYWQLALDSIKKYPYFNNFNNRIIDGWHQYSIGPNHKNIGDYRIRNMVAPGEALYQTQLKSGEWFTEIVRNQSWINEPLYFLETPCFDFSKMDSIFLSFDLMCTGGGQYSGGNLHFSTDGGNTWNVLSTIYGNAHNWFNQLSINTIDNEPGWSKFPNINLPKLLDSTSFDASFLKGKKDVVFRFKYKSKYENGNVQGLRVDNFNIEGFSVDYVANNIMDTLSSLLENRDLNINYSITNLGQSKGRITSTKFYWSEDSVWDNNDSLIFTQFEYPIGSEKTINSIAKITIPTPLNQTKYFLFYLTDGDSNLLETNELNNIGSYQISFPAYPNHFANIKMDSINALISQSTINVKYSIINNGLEDGIKSSTAFYWSNDSIFDNDDQKILSINENSILKNDTLIATINILYPTPINQSIYYLFYKTDHDNEILESDENDNIGTFKIYFDYQNSISNYSTFDVFNIYFNKNELTLINPLNFNENTYNLQLINSNGQSIYSEKIEINKGINKFYFPTNLTSGIYFINIQNNQTKFTQKIIIY